MPISRFDPILSTVRTEKPLSTSIAVLALLPMARATWPPPIENLSAKKKAPHRAGHKNHK
jgi:hypothetical protein